jgi:hypothetical protein
MLESQQTRFSRPAKHYFQGVPGFAGSIRRRSTSVTAIAPGTIWRGFAERSMNKQMHVTKAAHRE